jgi:FtsH-binding integral membrane protein
MRGSMQGEERYSHPPCMEHPPMDRLAPEPEPDSDGSSVVMRVGYIVAGGVISAVASSFPAALRMGEEGSASRALEQWIVLSALATPIGVAAVAVLRRARVGLRLLMGNKGHLLAIGVLWWSVVELGLLSMFGAVLRKTTHHHALAGVTFAAFAVVSGLLIGIFAHRTTAILARGGPNLERMGVAIAGGAAFVVIMLVGVRTSRAEGLHTAAALVDALALAVMSTITSSRAFTRFRPMAIAGVPVAVLLLMIGLTTLRFDPQVRESLMEAAPVHTLLISALKD